MRFRRFVVEGESMLPTLSPGDFVIGGRVDSVAPGDVVAFQHPERPGFWLIKRVIAAAGVVDLDAGTLDGRRYVDAHRVPEVESGRFDVPAGTMFVLSDNRRSTRSDSRRFGAVPIDVVYRVGSRYWPRPRRI
ncbi:MAG TPA: signal peptidase I [Acidimicrobiia bacterium]|jgi:signal peptidase I